MRQVAVVGLGMSGISRRAATPLGVLAVDACRRSLADAGLGPGDVDGLISNPGQPFADAPATDGISVVTPAFVAQAMQLDLNFCADVNHPVVGMAMIQGINAVAAGMSDCCVVYRALHSPAGSYGFTRGARSSYSGAKQFDLYGLQPPGRYALQASEYFHRHGVRREDLGVFVLQSRERGLRCEWGYWANVHPEQLTMDQYLASRMVSEPLCMYDCDLPVQVAGAFVLTTAERARDLGRPAAHVVGCSAPPYTSLADAYAGSVRSLATARDLGERAARQLWSRAGLTPADVDVVELYDGFSVLAPLWAEFLGFCDEGEGLRWITDSDVAANRSGGSIGTGRLHGLTHLTEAASQVMGRSGQRQVQDASFALAVVGSSPGTHVLFSSDAA